MSIGSVDFIKTRDEVVDFLREHLSSGHLVTHKFSIAKAANPSVTKCIVMVTYGEFFNKPSDSLTYFDGDDNNIHINIQPSIARDVDQILSRIYSSGTEVVNLLRDKSKYGSPPFGDNRITYIQVKSGGLGSAVKATRESKGGPAFHIVLGVYTLTS